MRKVLSFVLVLSLVLGSFSMAFAATPKDVVGEPCEAAVTVLSDLGVVSGYEDGTYKAENIVTRAEMAVLIIRALGLSDYVSATAKSKFPDMAGYGWAEGYIAYAESLGFISGYPDGTFKPGQTVSYDEAASMLVRALGYTAESLPGSWPANFVVKAKTLGILDGIKSGVAGANRGDVAIMLYQTLDQQIGTINKDGEFIPTNNGTATNPVDDTMLDRLGAEAYNNNEFFVVTDKEAKNESVMNLYPYIGAYVKAYQNSDDKIIAVKQVKSTFLTGSVKANGKFKAAGVEYTISGANYLGFTSVAAVTLENGEDTGVGTNAVTSTNGAVTLAVNLSGKTIKDVYSVATWDVDEHGFFTSDDVTDIEKDNELFGISFSENDNDEIDLNSFALLGASSLDDIEKDSVVYVYAASKEITRIEVGTEVVTGEVTRISGDDYTIAGKVYNFADQTDSDSITPDTGDTVKISLDYAGDIYKCELDKAAASNYAVVLDVKDGSAGFAGSDAKINLFLADGTEKAFTADVGEVADAIVVEATKVWTNAVTTGAIIKYSVDKDGLINEIVTTSAIPELADITSKGYYNVYGINSDAIIFTIDNLASPTKDADDYGVTTLDKVLNSDDVDAKYVLKDGKIVVMLIEADVASGDDVYGVVIDRARNNSDAGNEITFLIDGKEVTYNAKSSAYSQAANNELVYLVKFNTSGDVSEITSTVAAIETITPTDAGLTVSGNIVTITTAAGITTGPALANGAKITLDRDVVVYVWNVNDGCYEVGAIRDIAKAENSVRFFDVFDSDSVYDIVLLR